MVKFPVMSRQNGIGMQEARRHAAAGEDKLTAIILGARSQGRPGDWVISITESAGTLLARL